MRMSDYHKKLYEISLQKKQESTQKFKSFKERLKSSLKSTLDNLILCGRVTVYTNQVPFETDILRSNLYIMTAVSRLAKTILATGNSNATLACDLSCTPVSPGGLSVDVGPGAIYSYENLDSTAYGVLPADTNPDHKLFKQGINFDPVNFPTPAPVVNGDSIIYLIQASFSTTDVNDVSRPYFNSTDPNDPIFNNNFDTREDSVALSLKSGTSAPSPTPPTPDAGKIPLYYVTVTYGQTVIISGNITIATNAPFITEGLMNKISAVGAVTPIQLQNSTPIYAPNIGTANALVANVTPAYGAYQTGTRIFVLVPNSNTGPSTLQINSNPALAIQVMTQMGLKALAGGEMLGGGVYELFHNGTVFQLLNPNGAEGGTIQIGRITMQSGLNPDPGYLTLTSTAVSRSIYSRLYSYLGDEWGPGDGSTTFNIPPPGRVPVGAGWGGYPGLGDTVAETGGEAQHTLTIGELPTHNHPLNSSPGAISYVTQGTGGDTITVGGGAVGFSAVGVGNTGSNTPHNNIQPSMVLLFQIKY